MNVVFVGGGNAALSFLEMFAASNVVKIIGVVDPRPDAPAVQRARALGIPTSGDLAGFLKRPEVNVVLELTGNATVRQQILENMRPDQDIMSAGAGRMMYDSVSRMAADKNAALAAELANFTVQIRETVNKIDGTSCNINRVLREINMLSINASIEATRAGQSGAAFAVVAERMRGLVGEVQNSVKSIEESSRETHDLMSVVESTEQRLRG